MTPTLPPLRPSPGLNTFLFLVFCAALAAHFHFATMNWRFQFMAGHEFRQTQTALISYYIDKENNFTPDYSVPLLGKPWVLPLEFPLYQWCVVALARATDLPQIEAGRTISLSCFYLTLPALYWLFGQLGLSRPRRLLALACTLVCPVYIFYARAVLIDPMALLCAVWFLVAFVRALQTRRCRWLLLCALCGSAAGLIKSLVWFVWVVPAALYGAWCLWCDLRTPANWRLAVRTTAWGLGSMVVPLTVALCWASYTDAIKEVHPSAVVFTSHHLAHENYGTFSLATRFSGEVWQTLFARWQESILPAWALGLIVLPGIVFLRSVRWHIAGAATLFIVAQQLIPLAYAYQDYYFYAAAAFATAAITFALNGLLDSRLPRWLSAPLLLLPLAALLANYGRGYYVLQAVQSNGGSGLTESLRAYTPPESVLIVAGDDWSAVIPYYSRRKALMLRNGLESDHNYLARAFQDLAGEEVGALVLVGAQRSNRGLAELAAATFHLDPSPTYAHASADVYFNKAYRDATLVALRHSPYDQITTTAVPEATLPASDPSGVVSAAQARTTFSMVSPAPARARATFEFGIIEHEGERVLSAHPDSDIWILAPDDATAITLEFGFFPGAYQGADGRTDGVEFIVEAEAPDGALRPIHRRLLQPAATDTDQGPQQLTIPYQPASGDILVFRTRAHGNTSFDWAYWKRIAVK